MEKVTEYAHIKVSANLLSFRNRIGIWQPSFNVMAMFLQINVLTNIIICV